MWHRNHETASFGQDKTNETDSTRLHSGCQFQLFLTEARRFDYFSQCHKWNLVQFHIWKQKNRKYSEILGLFHMKPCLCWILAKNQLLFDLETRPQKKITPRPRGSEKNTSFGWKKTAERWTWHHFRFQKKLTRNQLYLVMKEFGNEKTHVF